MNKFAAFWIAWAAIGTASFLIVERAALKRKDRKSGEIDTLSSAVQWVVHRRPWTKWLFLGVTGAVFAWWVEHIW